MGRPRNHDVAYPFPASMCCCYFDVLAPELIQLIFTFCVEKRDGYFIEFKPDATPLSLLRVCKRWRHIAFQTPGLFDSISLRRRAREPAGFDFSRDSWILYEFFQFPRRANELLAKPRPLSVQLCYGDIRKYGDNLMWTELMHTARSILDGCTYLERIYLRFPDDCMDKFLMKTCSKPDKQFRNPNLRSLTLHSTRESLVVKRYITWWYDAESDYMPAYYHKLDMTQLPALEELGLHFPGPLTLDPICHTVRKLHVSIFKWEQLEEYLTGCPRVEDLTLELREPLADQDWDVDRIDLSLRFPRVHSLEVRSAIVGWACANKLLKLFVGLRVPNVKALRLRRLPQADKKEPPYFCHGQLIMSILNKVEELEFIDFALEPCGGWNIGTIFRNTPNLKRLVYREVEMVSCPEYFRQLISELTFTGKEVRAPRLEVLELDTLHLQHGDNVIVQDLLQLVASRRMSSYFVNTGMKRRKKAAALPCILRRVCLPLGCSDSVQRMDVLDMCKGVEFDRISTLEKLDMEDDLDEEGSPRDPSYERVGLRWPGVTPETEIERSDSESEVACRAHPTSRSGTSLCAEDSIMEVEKMLIEDEGSRTPRITSQGSFGLSRLDSLAEVELML